MVNLPMALPESHREPRTEPTADLGMDRSVVVPDFFSAATSLREVFDSRFQRFRADDPDSFVWDYWHVPGQYTYHRTYGDRYFPKPLVRAFLDRLQSWGMETLGCASVTPPWLSYYVDGCVQELHADVPHGPWAYVFSLTRWDDRGFSGGETLLMRPHHMDFWRGFDPSEALETYSLFDEIPACFNQLTVFDARVPHGVRAVSGTRDPLHGRVVLHGWFDYPRLLASEDLQEDKALTRLKLVATTLQRRLEQFDAVTGLLTARVDFGDGGQARSARVLTNTLVSTVGEPEAPGEVITAVLRALSELRLPGGSDGTWAVLPFRLPKATELAGV